MKASEMTAEYIKSEIAKNGFRLAHFRDEETGAQICVEAHPYGTGIKDFSEVGFYSMWCDKINSMAGHSDIERVIRDIQGIKQLIEANEDDKDKLAKYFQESLTHEKYQENEIEWLSHFEFYSDWYKDVYGVRPMMPRY